MSFNPNLKHGQELSNDEICSIFRCGSRGGMRRSKRTNTLVIISDHTKSFYEDRWQDDVFHYTGMGLTGNQNLMWHQNRTLYESDRNAVDVHLFEVFEKGKYVYQGRVKLAGKPYQEDQYDFKGNLRVVWIFPLTLVSKKHPTIIPDGIFRINQKLREKRARRLSDEELIKKISTYTRKVRVQRVLSKQYARNEHVAEYAKRRANGKCQLCGQNAPFNDKSNQPYLEVHHIQWLSKGGEDKIDNIVALCPNCHRKMHILNLQDDKRYLRSIINKKE